MDLETYVKEELDSVREDVKEIKGDVKRLLLFMAVEQDRNKKFSMIVSGLISLIISLVGIAVGKVL